MADVTIGLLHPGEMGSAVGAAARANAVRVLWASEGRSRGTRERAAAAGLEDAKTLVALVAGSDVILSICPPHAAVEVARAVAAQRFRGIYVDANAVSPPTAREIGRLAEQAGASFVDGSIIGPPPRSRGSTRLYLSGRHAERVLQCFDEGPFEAIRLEGGAGAASALKMAFASYTKGLSALLMAIRALAIREGVDEALLREWERSHPELPARSERAARDTARKAWRFVGEMEEIAATFDAAGLPDGFYRAAAEVYRRLAHHKDAPQPLLLAQVAKDLSQRST